MSLFGSTQPTTSPFANLGNNTAQQQSSLFAQPTIGTQQPGSNLFGNTTQNQSSQAQQPSSSLFGTSGQTQEAQQPPGSSNLFATLGQTNQQQQQPLTIGSSLFGNLNNASNQQQQQQTGTSNLFGGFGATSTQNPQQSSSTSGGLFSLGGQRPQQHQGTTGPLSWGGSTLNNATSGLQSQTQPSKTQNDQQSQGSLGSTGTSAAFQNLLERGKKRQAESNGMQFGELPSLQLGLGDIASKVRNLGGAGGFLKSGRAADSRTHYLLAASGVSFASTLRDLDELSSHTGAATSTIAAPQFDADIDTYVNHLQAKSREDLWRESLAQSKRDFDKFVEERIDIDREESLKRIYEHFGIAKPSENLNESANGISSPGPRGAFGRSSRRIRGPVSSDGTLTNASFGASAMARSVLGGSVGRGSVRASMFSDVSEQLDTTGAPSTLEDPSLRSKQEKYATKIRELNSARLQQAVYPVIEEFARVEIEAGSDTPQHLVDAYKVLKDITKENASVERPSDPGAVRERQYAKDYLNRSDPGKALAIRKQILAGSKAFLESSFFQMLETTVAKNPREANLGGVPSNVNKVRAYIRIRASRKDLGAETDTLQLLGDDYCWALIFYLIRSGLVQEAAQYVAEHERAIKSMDRHFTQYMAAYARDQERRLPRDMQIKIEREYSQRRGNSPENSIDPYRMACYKIVGRCDLGVKNVEGINTGMEDWMWVMLTLARELPRIDETAGESFGLEDARTIVEAVGQRHFLTSDDTVSGYATYFLLQILVGMFEKAVTWLQSHNYVAAVHFAIALNFYGLLRVSDFEPTETRLLTTTTSGLPQISFGRLLGYYTRDFRIARAEVATDYLTLICLNADLPGAAGQSQVSVCHEAFKELVLETREFALLLGDIRADGRRIKGAIEQRLKLIYLKDQDEFLRTLTIQAAGVADDSGRTTDAVLLYHLAEEYDNVILVINRALSEAISVELGREPMRLQPLKPRNAGVDKQQQAMEGSLSLTSVDDPAVLARSMIALYNVNAMYFQKIRQINRDACGILIRMSEAKTRVEIGRWAEALDMIASLDLLPLSAKGNVSVIRSSSQAFNSLPQVVARNIGSLLMWTVTCLGRQRQSIRSSAFQAQRPVADNMVVMAKDLEVFAGLIRYKLPPAIFEALAGAVQDVVSVY